MKVLDAMKKGFGLAAKSLGLVWLVFGISLVLIIVFSLLAVPFTPPAPQPKAGEIPMTPALVVINLVLFLLLMIVQAGVLASIKDGVKEHKVQLNRFAGYCKKFFLRLWGLLILIMAIIWIAALIATFVMGLSIPVGKIAVTVITGIIALVIGGVAVYIALLLVFSPYILIAEDTRVFESMKKSIAFVRSRLLKIMGLVPLLLVPFIINGVINRIALYLSRVIEGNIFILTAVVGILYLLVFWVLSYLNIAINASFMGYYLGSDRLEGSSTQA